MSEKNGQGGGAPEVSLHIIKSRKDLAFQGEGVLHSNALQAEDAFENMWWDGRNSGKVLRPPYDPFDLKRLVVENNTLNQCIEAMVVNIDGTGFDIVPKDDEQADGEDDREIAIANDFFAEPWPLESFITQRKQLRRDQEETGNAYLEVIRNAAREIVFTRRLDPLTVRICRLSDPIEVTKRISRDGRELEVKVWERERSFVQAVGTRKIYFREFGTSRDINKNDGKWGQIGSRLSADVRGTEVIHFTAQTDQDSPYGVPRWISQAPSVVGSRKAEELNLEYFQSGGIPPVLVMLQGGVMTEDNKRALENLLNGTAKHKLRAVVAEIQSATGTVDSANKVSVAVEKFGSEQQKDSLFENYDKRSAERVRGGFRLPSLFLGLNQDFNFATAFASYLVAEAQVFQPERMEFDEKITNTLIRGLGLNDVRMRSNNLTLADASVQLLALGMAEGIGIEEKTRALNEIAGLDLKVDENYVLQDQQSLANTNTPPQSTQSNTGESGAANADDLDEDEIIEEDSQGNVTRSANPRPGQRTGTRMADIGEDLQKSLVSDPFTLLELARDYANIALDPDGAHDPTFRQATAVMVKNLEEPDRTLFNRMLANQTMVSTYHDEAGAADLARGAAQLLIGD
jgi:PBSX family phage portal protein